MIALSLPTLTAAARSWSVESQQVARRNAMIAATACAQRRAERQDVDDFLRARFPRAGGATDGSGGTATETRRRRDTRVQRAHG